MKKIIYGLAAAVVFVLALTLNLKNPQLVTINYYFDLQWQTSLVLALTAAFAVGLLCGWLIMALSVFKNKMRVGKTKKQLAKIEEEVENLRSMPIKDEV